MTFLPLKIPPLLLAGLTALLMLLPVMLRTGHISGWHGLRSPLLVITLALFFAGAVFCLAGVASFRRARTTVNPMRPQQASTLVQTGVYRLSRNPIYTGFVLLLGALAMVLGNYLSALCIPLFMSYMNHFQIEAEEKALSELFGDEYRAYCQRVRRWL